MNVPDYVVSLLRTAVPSAIGSLISWLALRGLVIDDQVRTAFVTGATGLAIIAWYALWRAIESHLPPWLTRIVLGSNTTPTYAPTGADGVPDISSLPAPEQVTDGLAGDGEVPDAPVVDDVIDDENPADNA